MYVTVMGLARELVASCRPPSDLCHDNYSGGEEGDVCSRKSPLPFRPPTGLAVVRRLTPSSYNYRFMYSQGSSRDQDQGPQGADHDAYARRGGDNETATGLGSLGIGDCMDQLGDVDLDGPSQSDRLVRRGRSGGGVPWDIR